MSFENAILVHAAALEKLAAAIATAFGNGISLQATPVLEGGLVQTAIDSAVAAKDKKADVKPDADLDAAVGKVEDAATQTKAIDKAELAKMKADVKAKKDADAAAAASAANSAAAGADSSGDDLDDGLDTPPDYVKDVRPVLLAAIKRAGKDKVQELIATFGVDKGDKVDPAKLGDLMIKAQRLGA